MNNFLSIVKKLQIKIIQEPEGFLLLKGCAERGVVKPRYPVANVRPVLADALLSVDRRPFFLLDSIYAVLARICVRERNVCNRSPRAC